MLKKNKVLILISVFVLMFSIFTLSACSNKAANKSKLKLYDVNGLPLTKEAALKLWQGKWQDKSNQQFMNEIDEENRLSPLGFVNGNHVNRYFLMCPTFFDTKTFTLTLNNPLDGSFYMSFKFVNKNTLLAKIHTNTETTYTRVVE